jgi:hypothetical protein
MRVTKNIERFPLVQPKALSKCVDTFTKVAETK